MSNFKIKRFLIYSDVDIQISGSGSGRDRPRKTEAEKRPLTVSYLRSSVSTVSFRYEELVISWKKLNFISVVIFFFSSSLVFALIAYRHPCSFCEKMRNIAFS